MLFGALHVTEQLLRGARIDLFFSLKRGVWGSRFASLEHFVRAGLYLLYRRNLECNFSAKNFPDTYGRTDSCAFLCFPSLSPHSVEKKKTDLTDKPTPLVAAAAQ